MVKKYVGRPGWEGYEGETAKLGDLVIDRRTWVREEFNKDHIRCLVNDLVNGAEFPPLKADRETCIVVSGNHRWHAYKQYYGDSWEEKEVPVIWVELPSYEEDPMAWYKLGLDENKHLTARLRYHDRNAVGKKLVDCVEDPIHNEEVQGMVKNLHFTTNSWAEFVNILTQRLKDRGAGKWEEEGEQEAEKRETVPREQGTTLPRSKSPTGDISSEDFVSRTDQALIMSKASGLIRLIEDIDPCRLSGQNLSLLGRLEKIIRRILEEVA